MKAKAFGKIRAASEAEQVTDTRQNNASDAPRTLALVAASEQAVKDAEFPLNATLTALSKIVDLSAELERSNAGLVEALRGLLGGPALGDEKIGWLGHTPPTPNHFQCEFCRAANLDCTLIEHTSICPIPAARAALKASMDTDSQQTTRDK